MDFHTRRERWRKHVAELPTTNLRIYTTLLLTVMTGIVYLGLAVARLAMIAGGADLKIYPIWEPSWEWLVFIAAVSGIDVAQFATKRATNADYQKAIRANGIEEVKDA